MASGLPIHPEPGLQDRRYARVLNRQQSVHDAIDELTDEYARAGIATTPEPFMTRTELAKLMGVSTATVDRLRREGMPSVVWGARSRRFRPSTALAWAQARPLHSQYVNAPATRLGASGGLAPQKGGLRDATGA